MIAIMPHAEPDGDEDHLDREGGANGGTSVAEKRIRNHVERLNREGPIHARRLKLYADALIHLVDAFNDKDPHAFEEAADECVDCLHDLIQTKRRGQK
jgi:hypothetical protein